MASNPVSDAMRMALHKKMGKKIEVKDMNLKRVPVRDDNKKESKRSEALEKK
jgi:hypothetical protein